MPESRARALLINASLAVLSLLLVTCGAEIALRVLLARGLNPFQPDEVIGFRLKPSFEGVYPRVSVRTDSHGHRVPMAQKADGTGRFLFIGDSVTFGFSIAAEASFPVRLGARLDDPLGVTNAAVPGYNLDQALVLAREQIARRAPDWILYGLVINDIGQSQSPGRYEDIDPHAARSDGLLRSSYLVSFIERRFTRIRMRFLPDEEDPVRRATGSGDAAASAGGRDPAALPAAAIEAFDRQWERLEALQREAGVPVYVLVCPYSQQVEGTEGEAYQRFVARRCEGSNLICLDPLEVLRAAAAEPVYTVGSSYHFNERGHEIVAEWLYDRVADSGPRPAREDR